MHKRDTNTTNLGSATKIGNEVSQHLPYESHEVQPTLQPYSWFHKGDQCPLDTLLSQAKDIAEGVSVLVRLGELNRYSGDKILSEQDASSLERLSASVLQMLSTALDDHFASENRARRESVK